MPCGVGLFQAGGDDRHLIDLIRVTAAGQIVDRRVQTLQNRAVGLEAAQTLGDFVANVARVDIRENKGVGLAGNRRALALGRRNDRGERGVELQLAVYREIRRSRFSFFGCILHHINRFALAGAFGRVG